MEVLVKTRLLIYRKKTISNHHASSIKPHVKKNGQNYCKNISNNRYIDIRFG